MKDAKKTIKQMVETENGHLKHDGKYKNSKRQRQKWRMETQNENEN